MNRSNQKPVTSSTIPGGSAMQCGGSNQNFWFLCPGHWFLRSLDCPLAIILALTIFCAPLHASEVLDDTSTHVQVRNHPRTGKPFVSITSEAAWNRNPFRPSQLLKRPDYRMLDPKMKSGEIPYEGPVSDRKKVYGFAAALAAVGTVGGVGIIAAAPAATGAGAAGGAGFYGAAGGAVTAGTISTAAAGARSYPKSENFKQVAEAHSVGEEKRTNGTSLRSECEAISEIASHSARDDEYR